MVAGIVPGLRRAGGAHIVAAMARSASLLPMPVIMPTIMPVLVLVAVAAGGCRTESAGTDFYPGGHPNQKYDFAEVGRAVRKIPPGTARQDVMIQLGSPAQINGNTWIYLPEDPGFLVPKKLLEVRFRGGYFVDYEFKPIVFGQKQAG